MQFIPEINVIDLGNYTIEIKRTKVEYATYSIFHNGRKVLPGRAHTMREAEEAARHWLGVYMSTL